MHFYLTNYYLQYPALIITDSAQLFGLTIGKICQNYIIYVSDIFHIPTCTTYLSTAFMLTLQTVYVQKNGKGPFLVLAIRNVKILIIKRFIRVLPSALRTACNLKISITMC